MGALNESHCLNGSAAVPLARAIDWAIKQDDYFRQTLFFFFFLPINFRHSGLVGRLAYVSTTACAVVFVYSLGASLSLDGAKDGLRHLVRVKGEDLASARLWLEVGGEMVVLFGTGTSSVFAISTSRKFYNNCVRDALVSGLVTLVWPILAVCTVFSVLGHLKDAGQGGGDDPVKVAPLGLLFTAVSALSAHQPNTFAAVFFVCVLLAGFTTTFSLLEMMMSNLLHLRMDIRSKKCLVMFGMCCVGFLLALPFCWQGGIFWLVLVDKYLPLAAAIPLLLAEVLAIICVYGRRRLFTDINKMLGRLNWPTKMYLSLAWHFTVPLTLVILLGLVVVVPLRLSFGRHQLQAEVVKGFFLALVLACLVFGVIIALWCECKDEEQNVDGDSGETNNRKHACIQRVLEPKPDWKPCHLLFHGMEHSFDG
ncbi:unnamed protein product [Notodromas monacha]|uniref:Uncharacterized protein n=1 Tax=Notodromas monacha TaxID=399045 RepID=A0A7R9GAQ8_9CRUS|nr:unnamed protein product [Notodromas monacha]CAG0915520.1 unnamed protein product [Notodromas monacha]